MSTSYTQYGGGPQTVSHHLKNMNPAATAQYNHYNQTANSLDQYGAAANHYQFASINQSMLIRNLNYSILQGELEHEAALEDMHMFFVAFNKRQKRIVENLEVKKTTDESKILDELSPNKDASKLLIGASSGQGTTAASNGINVQFVDEELDLE